MKLGLGLGLDKTKIKSLYGPELITNGDFSSGSTGWAVSGEDGTHIATFATNTARYQSDTTSPQLLINQNSVLEVGKNYKITIVTSAWTSGTLKTDSFGTNDTISNAAGTITITGEAVTTTWVMTRNGTDVDTTIDSVSVREVL